MKIEQIIDGYEGRFEYEDALFEEGIKVIAGIDEVGRGALAGPVVASAVILDRKVDIPELYDSKQLSAKRRLALYDQIMQSALGIGCSVIEPAKVDEIDVYQASILAMTQAVDNLPIKPEHLLIDAMELDNGIAQTKLIKGDQKSNSIAAASIIAKVTRDRIMAEYDEKYPEYGFVKNVGYGTKQHMNALNKLGITPIHRMTYAPVAAANKNQKLRNK